MLGRQQRLAIVSAGAILGAVAVAGAAQAQDPVPFNAKATAISAADQAAIMRATHQALEQRTAGATVAWTGGKTKTAGVSSASGTIKVLKVFDEGGRPCGEVENVFTPSGAAAGARPRHYVLEYCKLSTGLWKLGM